MFIHALRKITVDENGRLNEETNKMRENVSKRADIT